MSLRVIVSPTGKSATVAGAFHSTQMDGIADAERWVAFYEKMAAGKSGRFHRARLAAFQQALRDMKARQAGVRDGH